MIRQERKDLYRQSIELIVVVMCIFATINAILAVPGTNTQSETIREGESYLSNQESQDISDLESYFEQRNRMDLYTAFENGDINIFSFFRNSVLLGDSRVYGFQSYGFLPSSQVFANAGDTIEKASSYAQQIAQLQPETIYISYGVNDMGLSIGADLGEDGYAQVFEQQVDALLAVSPNSKIVVGSIIEPTPAAIEKSPRWGKAADYNAQLEALCERRGWTYIDNEPLSKGGYADIYQADGVHFLSTFYPVWAANLLGDTLG